LRNATSPAAAATLPDGATDYITSSLPDGTWFWRVMATDNNGASSGYSSATVVNGCHFRIDTSSPTNVGCFIPAKDSYDVPISTILKCQIATDTLSAVDKYQFEISTATAFNGSDDYEPDWQSGVTYDPSPDLSYGATYYWRIRVKDNAGNISSWRGDLDSDGYWKFIVEEAPDITPPCAVSNLTAITGNDDGEVKLVWTAPGDDGTGGEISGGSLLHLFEGRSHFLHDAGNGTFIHDDGALLRDDILLCGEACRR